MVEEYKEDGNQGLGRFEIQDFLVWVFWNWNKEKSAVEKLTKPTLQFPKAITREMLAFAIHNTVGVKRPSNIPLWIPKYDKAQHFREQTIEAGECMHDFKHQ
jgi:hypothetical protein